MAYPLEHFISKLNGRAPGEPETLTSLRGLVPDDYLSFLSISNGGEGWISQNAYVQLLPAEDIREHNDVLETAQHLPGAILFGSDGAEMEYGARCSGADWQYFQVPAVGMQWEDAQPLGASLLEFFQSLAMQ